MNDGHQYRVVRTFDGCHCQLVWERCAGCQIERALVLRRDFAEPAALLFAERNCPVCLELLAGSEPAIWGVR